MTIESQGQWEKGRRLGCLFRRVADLVAAIENRPHDFGTGDLLYRAEIHLLDSIGQQGQANVTELAELKGVSKAAISRKVAALEKKELVRRFFRADNRKEVHFGLTPKGRVAFENHLRFHERLDRELADQFGDFTTADLDAVARFLEVGERLLREHAK